MMEKTLVLLKPDAVQRTVCGRILSRFEDTGLKIIGMKMVWVDKEFVEKHYYDVKERHGQKILDNLTTYLKSGPVIAMVLEGIEAIALVRKLTGSTYPNEAPPGTIRGDFAHISKAYANQYSKNVNNLIHASANPKDAEHEINLWFKPEELHSYKTVHESHVF